MLRASETADIAAVNRVDEFLVWPFETADTAAAVESRSLFSDAHACKNT